MLFREINKCIFFILEERIAEEGLNLLGIQLDGENNVDNGDRLFVGDADQTSESEINITTNFDKLENESTIDWAKYLNTVDGVMDEDIATEPPATLMPSRSEGNWASQSKVDEIRLQIDESFGLSDYAKVTKDFQHSSNSSTMHGLEEVLVDTSSMENDNYSLYLVPIYDQTSQVHTADSFRRLAASLRNDADSFRKFQMQSTFKTRSEIIIPFKPNITKSKQSPNASIIWKMRKICEEDVEIPMIDCKRQMPRRLKQDFSTGLKIDDFVVFPVLEEEKDKRPATRTTKVKGEKKPSKAKRIKVACEQDEEMVAESSVIEPMVIAEAVSPLSMETSHCVKPMLRRSMRRS